tara:strand:- start:38713 stop:39627 length:915 start_codon:yes stop_codon:yes gene_type:complete
MVINKIKLIAASYLQDRLIFPTKDVAAYDMRVDETFNNRVNIEIPIPSTKTTKTKNMKPEAVLRGVLCKSIIHNSPTIIFAMGQTQNVEQARKFIPESLFHYFNIILVNYRGYGINNGTKEQKARGSEGIPSAEALEKDILTVYDYVQKEFGLNNFYAVGLSLGTSIITYLSKHRPLHGQLLITPFDNMLNQAHDFLISEYKATDLTHDDVNEILNHKFDSIRNMQNNETPTHIIRAGADSYVKKPRTDNLVKHIQNLRSDVTIEHAEHNFDSENPYIISALRTAIGTVFRNFMIDCTERHRAK